MTDASIPDDRNVIQKKAENKLKYKGLCKEIQRKWNMKCSIIPAATGADRNSDKSFKEKPGIHTRKTFSRFTTKDGYT